MKQNNSPRKGKTVRLSLPSKGRLCDGSMIFLENCGLKVDKPNPRQYQASIKGIKDLTILFQRPSDIVISVREGSVEFGITGLDVVEEHKGQNGDVLILHDDLSFGRCLLTLAVPEGWDGIVDMDSLKTMPDQMGRDIRVATKFPNVTGKFLDIHQIPHKLIYAEGTLETAPEIGYADIISDLVSSGQTLRDNRLRALSDGIILKSQASLIANFQALKNNPNVLQHARLLLEYFEAYQRANENLAIFANMRGSSPEEISGKIFAQKTIGGLQGPTVSQIVTRDHDPNWYAVNIIVKKTRLYEAVSELRSIGGSGVVVLPVRYIFEEEPPRYSAMVKAISAS